MRGLVACAALLLLFLGGVGAYFVARSETSATGAVPPTSAHEDDSVADVGRPLVDEGMRRRRAERAEADAPETPRVPPSESGPDGDASPTTESGADEVEEPEAGRESVKKRETASEKAAAEVEKALETKVRIALEGKSLLEAAEAIGEAAGVPVNVDLEGADAMPVTLQLSDVTAHMALHVLASIAGGLEVVVEDDHVTLRKKD